MDVSKLFPKGSPVCLISSNGSPRLMVLSENYRTKWKGSSLFPAYRLPAKIWKLFLRISILLQQQKKITDTDWIFDELIGEVFYSLQKIKPWAILLGNGISSGKYILEMRDDTGRVVAYLKFAESRIPKMRIEREYMLLKELPRGIAPEVLGFKVVADGFAMLITPIDGTQLSANIRFESKILNYLVSFPRYSSCEAYKHPWVVRIASTNMGIFDKHISNLSIRKWDIVLQHGDFAPWNLIMKNSHIIACDWEYGTLNGFPGRDLVYYMLQVGALINRWSPSVTQDYVINKLNMLPNLNLTDNVSESLVKLTAYDAYLNSREDGLSDDSYIQNWRKAIWT